MLCLDFIMEKKQNTLYNADSKDAVPLTIQSTQVISATSKLVNTMSNLYLYVMCNEVLFYFKQSILIEPLVYILTYQYEKKSLFHMPHAGEVLWLLGKLLRRSETLTQATKQRTK